MTSRFFLYGPADDPPPDCDWCGLAGELVEVEPTHAAPERICLDCRRDAVTENNGPAGIRWSCDFCDLQLVESEDACEHIEEDYL